MTDHYIECIDRSIALAQKCMPEDGSARSIASSPIRCGTKSGSPKPTSTTTNSTASPSELASPGKSSADRGWVQHMLVSLNEKVGAGVVLDTGAASRSSENVGKNKEKTVRQWFVDPDLIESVRSEIQHLCALLTQQTSRNFAITQAL